ncbi:2-phosphosulfolactate phosphatase [Nakamurella sp. UYEF19]|uniref:2-phosphosulfolactate phosphatase n=1 Tax=Nakamurella sp. UYEF19 TaxID=1756392 RepID=UPI003394C25B
MTPPARNDHRQSGWAIRFDWGLSGATAIADGAGAVVVVDVLSFTTTLSVAIDEGIEVYPFRIRDASAAAFAATRGAVLAIGRREAGPTGVSLSPLSVQEAARTGPLATSRKLVLPSPNGSTISRQLAESGAVVVGACLRNAAAVAAWITAGAVRGPVAVVAAGERWPGDQLRPAVEDLWGAGAVVNALLRCGFGTASPEAGAAAAAYRELDRTVGPALASCASGQELIADGYGTEIDLAAQENVSSKVPVLVGESFRSV